MEGQFFEHPSPDSPQARHNEEGDGARPRVELHPAGKQDVELYIRTFNTMLRSSGEVKIKALEAVHTSADSSLHIGAGSPEPDMAAFLYSVQRLPQAIMQVRRVLLGQSGSIFHRHGYQVEEWEPVSAPGRRRHWFFDGHETLAVFVNSSSDVDDLMPTLTGFQIEWNKLHRLLNADPSTMELIDAGEMASSPVYHEVVKAVQQRIAISPDDWERLEQVWEDLMRHNLAIIARAEKSFTVQMLGGSYVGYSKATARWWSSIAGRLHELGLQRRPVYFVSSNTHSLANTLSGSVSRVAPQIIEYIKKGADPALATELRLIESRASRASLENFLYFTSRNYYQNGVGGRDAQKLRVQEELERGIYHIPSRAGLPIDTQIIDLSKLRPEDIDPRIRSEDAALLARSNAIIINIDYPLGLAAYYIFLQIAESVEEIKGVYILGKAATLNGRIGDVMISDSVYDEHSTNTYWLNNAFTAADVSPFLVYGAVLDNQKAVTVKGTYLQNRGYLDFYYRENYTVVEMEAGPYLNALYESTYPTRHPLGEHINFTKLPYDVGILHYASDTPYTQGANLGRGSLAYYGVESAYATTLAIGNRILEHEIEELRQQAAQEPEPQPEVSIAEERAVLATEG